MEQPKILVVAHDQLSSHFICSKLESRNFTVLAAANCQKALQIFQNDEPDLVLLDMTLPHAEGFRICRLIKEHSEIPIIMLSERNDTLDEIQGLDIGADDFIVKPFSMDVLTSKVKAVLRRTRKNSGYYANGEKSEFAAAGR